MSGDVQFMMSGIGPMVPPDTVAEDPGPGRHQRETQRTAARPAHRHRGGPARLHQHGVYALLAPANVPPDIVKRLNESTRAALQNPDLIAKLTAQGVEQRGSSPEELEPVPGGGRSQMDGDGR